MSCQATGKEEKLKTTDDLWMSHIRSKKSIPSWLKFNMWKCYEKGFESTKEDLGTSDPAALTWSWRVSSYHDFAREVIMGNYVYGSWPVDLDLWPVRWSLYILMTMSNLMILCSSAGSCAGTSTQMWPTCWHRKAGSPVRPRRTQTTTSNTRFGWRCVCSRSLPIYSWWDECECEAVCV